MAKRLTLSVRQKLEKEIAHNVSLLGANTQECEDYITELEALLRQHKAAADSAEGELKNSERKLAEARGRMEAQKDDIQTMRTDAKLAAMQQASSDKELAQLQNQLDDALNDGQAFADELREKLANEQSALQAERHRHESAEKEWAQRLEAMAAASAAEVKAAERALAEQQKAAGAEAAALQASMAKELKATEQARLAQAQAADAERAAALKAQAEGEKAREELKEELDALHLTLNEYRECDKALRERIATLEELLSEERKKAGQDLLLRIMELETMLEAERNKVDDLDELPTVVHVTHASAMQTQSAAKTTGKSEKTVGKRANKR